jgi:hypothetical protein
MGVARQLGLLDPLSVAWELLPWSFVIDWFIPIGAYLDVLNGIPALKGRFLTTEVIRRVGIQGVPGVKSPWYTLGMPTYRSVIMGVLARPSLYHKKVSITRTYSEELPIPLPNPHLGGAVHGRRLWNAIALAQQRFGPPVLRSKPGLLVGDLARLKVL